MTREEAIKIIDCYDIGFYDLSGAKIPADKLADAFDMAIEALSAEPSVQMSEVTYTDRQHGEWVRSGDADEPTTFFTKWECSVCGYSNGRRFNSNYCPNCGAQMIKGYAKGDMK